MLLTEALVNANPNLNKISSSILLNSVERNTTPRTKLSAKGNPSLA